MRIGIQMIFTKIKNRIKEAFIISGYSRTAKELLELSDRQLEDIGFSRALLKRGVSAYPWREESLIQVIPDNVSNLNTTKIVAQTPIMPQTKKAA